MKVSKDQLSLFSEKAIPKVSQWEYLVILSPTEVISNDIHLLKEKIKALQLNCDSLYSLPHITLKNYLNTNASEADIISKVLAGQKSFPVKIIGQSIFQHGAKKTLYLKIENPEPIQLLHALLTGKSAKNFVPHITIAKNIIPLDFEKLEGSLSEFDYKNQWQAESIVVLKRLHDAKNRKFEIAAEISLGK